ncbi:UBP-type zinc finger domain-containing protein, partial [Escherichia coli]|uniref:UBP-type zinc finger domain-containing protein n=1 Tax=Escherichia coli TaxID=562 RepID=UPI003D360F35
MTSCRHSITINEVTPSARGCEECLKIGSVWLHLRLCRSCGHVGCCDQSPHRHARAYFNATQHPIIEGYDPPEGWG